MFSFDTLQCIYTSKLYILAVLLIFLNRVFHIFLVFLNFSIDISKVFFGCFSNMFTYFMNFVSWIYQIRQFATDNLLPTIRVPEIERKKANKEGKTQIYPILSPQCVPSQLWLCIKDWLYSINSSQHVHDFWHWFPFLFNK